MWKPRCGLHHFTNKCEDADYSSMSREGERGVSLPWKACADITRQKRRPPRHGRQVRSLLPAEGERGAPSPQVKLARLHTSRPSHRAEVHKGYGEIFSAALAGAKMLTTAPSARRVSAQRPLSPPCQARRTAEETGRKRLAVLAHNRKQGCQHGTGKRI